MKVSELREALEQYPDDLEILFRCFSDYRELEVDMLYVDKAVMKDGWAMRSHPTMSEINKSLEKEYLILPGN